MRKIPLTKGLFAIVDEEDFAWLSQWKWTASFNARNSKCYAIRRARKNESVKERTRIAMHRAIVKCPREMVVDHKNGNPLDNRRSNLEIVTQKENMNRVPNWRQGGATANV